MNKFACCGMETSLYYYVYMAIPVKKNQGLTLIEVLLVVALFAIIAASSTPFYSRFVVQNQLSSASTRIISSLRKAQQYAIDGRGDAVWGVCLDAGVVRMYSGSCASPTTSDDFELPSVVDVTGLSDVFFSQRGEPNSPTTITISTPIGTEEITINQAGKIE